MVTQPDLAALSHGALSVRQCHAHNCPEWPAYGWINGEGVQVWGCQHHLTQGHRDFFAGKRPAIGSNPARVVAPVPSPSLPPSPKGPAQGSFL